MTDYNDGKWHGWNGGECPVHPQSRVNVIWDDLSGSVGVDSRIADHIGWTSEGFPPVAFRVVKAYRDPREWWATGKHLHDSLEEAKAFVSLLSENHPGRGYESTPIVHVREVLE